MHSKEAIAAAIDHAAHLLPGQRPLEAFVHHNTLHAFEHQPFHEALAEASALYGTAMWMDEAAFRQAWREGRVQERDLQEVLERNLGDRRAPPPLEGRTVASVVADLMLHQPAVPPTEVQDWLLHEERVLEELPAELPRGSRERLARAGDAAELLTDLWDRAPRCCPPSAVEVGVRLRDRLVAAGAGDPDEVVDPFLIRWLGAYLDHGTSGWAMGHRPAGLLRAALRFWSEQPPLRPWQAGLATRAAELLARDADAPDVIAGCLERLGVAEEGVETYVLSTLLTLRGWAGIVVQLGARPDLAPADSPPTDLADVLALRLLLDEVVARHLWAAGRAELAEPLLDALPPAEARGDEASRRWRVFSGATTLGVLPRELDALSDDGLLAFGALVLAWDEAARGLLWQEAYELRYRVEILDAIVLHRPRVEPPSTPPDAQIVCCIDDREESFRRAIEELSPRWQTFGYAGFYGLAMYWQALGEHRPRPLCPAGVVPQRIVLEELAEPSAGGWGRITARSRLLGSLIASLSISARTILRGGLASVAGWGALIPLVTRTLAPRLHGRLAARSARPATRMTLLADGRIDEHSGLQVGFSLDEATDIVASGLRTMGLTAGLAPLVVTLGHGSRSLNNPHEAAHDCGACGGGRGGPNGRGFAWFANHPEIRERLRARGIDIPDSIWFIGGYHNTCDDALDLYDLDAVPPRFHELLAELQADLETARALDAHERCRRFESAPLQLSPAEALAHVEGRAEDLSQPRPEYGHATNALCLVGRRWWSRGLFLDRRVFLTSYDPTVDPDGGVLQALLAAVGPVGAGINLEYYFSFVDPSSYGSGTKLPHNIAGLLGVMDGHSSDLRTGLPWQMVEIHEPVRLLNVIEGTPEQVDRALAALPAVDQLVRHRWILLAAYDPDRNQAWFRQPEGWERHELRDPHLPSSPSSLRWYGGRRGHLPPASIHSTPEVRRGA